MFDAVIWNSVALAIIAFAFGMAFGWRLRAMMRDRALEMRVQAADLDELRAALTDSQNRCDQQAKWLTALEAEVVPLRAKAQGGPRAAG
ncbi:hypothetical protein SAMN05216227_101832 [Pseudorhodobacter antarcticus]|uniref:Uncharacterized protein n=1 Tax=Pseudorhodobacter antarcticus TaxID=1077947 RepID=A0A1H8HWZ9_9RHOB|nr:hypothetical protein [Pseudorhodobacter antarcticus]SEN60238.1 hypothetical protein SAMN05216227_101832 [Pseudorhodobacter antarcticus]